MHELPLVKSIMKSVLNKASEAGASRVVRVALEAGELREIVPPIMQKFWDYASAGTVCEGARLDLTVIPARARCGRCGSEYQLNMDDLMHSNCPECGFEEGELINGRELIIRGIEIA